MRRLMFSSLLLLGLATVAEAQTTTPNPTITWDQPESSLANAQGAIYTLYIGNTQQVVKHTCTGTASPFSCIAPLAGLTPGAQTLFLTMKRVINGSTIETLPSNGLNITVLVLAAPQNLRLVNP